MTLVTPNNIAVAIAAPYLTPKFIERLQGVASYAVSHTSSYSFIAYLRYIKEKNIPMGRDRESTQRLVITYELFTKDWQPDNYLAGHNGVSFNLKKAIQLAFLEVLPTQGHIPKTEQLCYTLVDGYM